MKKMCFYEAGVQQIRSETRQVGRNNTSKHTGQPCPCRPGPSNIETMLSALSEVEKAETK